VFDTGRHWLSSQILEWTGKAIQGQTGSSLLQTIVNYSCKSYIALGPEPGWIFCRCNEVSYLKIDTKVLGPKCQVCNNFKNYFQKEIKIIKG
jgi:hypothetical protein